MTGCARRLDARQQQVRGLGGETNIWFETNLATDRFGELASLPLEVRRKLDHHIEIARRHDVAACVGAIASRSGSFAHSATAGDRSTRGVGPWSDTPPIQRDRDAPPRRKSELRHREPFPPGGSPVRRDDTSIRREGRRPDLAAAARRRPWMRRSSRGRRRRDRDVALASSADPFDREVETDAATSGPLARFRLIRARSSPRQVVRERPSRTAW